MNPSSPCTMRKFTSYLVFSFHDSAIERDHFQSNNFVESSSLYRLSEDSYASAGAETRGGRGAGAAAQPGGPGPTDALLQQTLQTSQVSESQLVSRGQLSNLRAPGGSPAPFKSSADINRSRFWPYSVGWNSLHLKSTRQCREPFLSLS
jgi:hypothetical protein